MSKLLGMENNTKIPDSRQGKDVVILPPVPEKKQIIRERPLWWRGGWPLYIVLLLAAIVGDLMFPVAKSIQCGIGVGSGIGAILIAVAIILLRRDFSRREQVFLLLLSIVCGVSMAASGSVLSWWLILVVPFVMICMLPGTIEVDWTKRYYNWYTYWLSARTRERQSALARFLPLFCSILAGIVAFSFFLCILAWGNPVVQLLWQEIADLWNRLILFFHLDQDFWVHALLCVLGVVLFAVFTGKRISKEVCNSDGENVSSSRGLLPQLPFMTLLGINLAYMINNAADMAYLCFRRVPEGVSQTEYLLNGADNIIWAALLSSCILIILFRAKGRARSGAWTRSLGYLLVVQTFLLALSVYLRLYYQIEEYGFTCRRILAGEIMLFGLLGLVVLLCYMVKPNLRRWACYGLAVASLLLGVTQLNPPQSLAGDLNMRYGMLPPGATGQQMPTMRWKFTMADCVRHIPAHANLAFAYHVYETTKHEMVEYDRKVAMQTLLIAANAVERRARSNSFLQSYLLLKRDIPIAERILGRPIIPRSVENVH